MRFTVQYKDKEIYIMHAKQAAKCARVVSQRHDEHRRFESKLRNVQVVWLALWLPSPTLRQARKEDNTSWKLSQFILLCY